MARFCTWFDTERLNIGGNGPWSGDGELLGQRKRNRWLDVEKLPWLLRSSDLGEFRLHFNRAIEESMAKDEMRREPKLINGLAVGSQTYVENMKGEIRNRQTLASRQVGNEWILKDEYSAPLEAEKLPTGCSSVLIPAQPYQPQKSSLVRPATELCAL